MIPIFLINLDRSPDRLARMAQQLQALGLPFTRIAASDGQKLTESERAVMDARAFYLLHGRAPVAGEIGCAASHWRVWQIMQSHNLAHALILEDDVTLDAQLPDFLNTMGHFEDLDVINLALNRPYELDSSALAALIEQKSCARPAFWRSRRRWKKLEHRGRWKIYRLRPLRDVVVCECDPAPVYTCGYILSQKGAQALSRQMPLSVPVDVSWRYCDGQLRQAFLARPLIAPVQGESSIGPRVADATRVLTMRERIERHWLKATRRRKRRQDVRRLYGLKRIL